MTRPTDLTRPSTRRWGRIALAACALPGVMPALLPDTAHAEEPPEQAVIAAKLAGYQDSQPGLKRLSVHTPSLYLLTPVGSHWAAEGSLTRDEVSGATPRYYTDVSGASRMHDQRTAGDVRLTRYFDRDTVSTGLAYSTEHDYVSTALSLAATHASDDQNTTWNAGLGVSRDRINPVNGAVHNERRSGLELQGGVTQALSPRDLVQATLTASLGSGYYSDPYKLYDNRPRTRNAGIAVLRWNHALSGDGGLAGWFGGALKTQYRLYHDSFGINAHTVELAWAKPVGERLTLTPLLRYHTQNAARFYIDPASDPSVYPGPFGSPRYSSADQRLAAFGAATVGLRADLRLGAQWSLDSKVEVYTQDSQARVLLGRGSPGLAPLTAVMWQIGVSRRF